MTLPIIIAVPVAVLFSIIYFAGQIIYKDFKEWKKLEDEVEKQANESERPHIEPMYRRRHKK